MTGEVSLRGRVIAIGGLREKSMAAYKAGIKTVLVPADNRPDYEKLDDFLKEGMEYIVCSTVEDVLKQALLIPKEPEVNLEEPKQLHLPVESIQNTNRKGTSREGQYQ